MGLKLTYIQTREELNEVEQANILEAQEWAMARRRANLLTLDFMCALHKRMFGGVWDWAGNFTKQSNRLLGVDAHEVGPELRKLVGDVQYWIDHQTFSADEIAVRFHQRLTRVHPFPNGNGRHARLMTDLLLIHMKQPAFSWGSRRLREQGEDRSAYIEALRRADRGDYTDLLKVVRA
jgi:Fic-DOC domain mobile mystery protein B